VALEPALTPARFGCAVENWVVGQGSPPLCAAGASRYEWQAWTIPAGRSVWRGLPFQPRDALMSASPGPRCANECCESHAHAAEGRELAGNARDGERDSPHSGPGSPANTGKMVPDPFVDAVHTDTVAARSGPLSMANGRKDAGASHALLEDVSRTVRVARMPSLAERDRLRVKVWPCIVGQRMGRVAPAPRVTTRGLLAATVRWTAAGGAANTGNIVVMTRTAPGVRPSRVLAAHRVQVLEIARSRGASNVRVFGSIARDEDGPSSDVDLLVDFPAGTSLLTVIGLEQSLRELLGVPVDVGPADALRDDMREAVLTEARAL
jgi:uncharacterized protein